MGNVWKMRYVLIEFKDGTRPMRVSYFTRSDTEALEKAKKDYGQISSRIELEMGFL